MAAILLALAGILAVAAVSYVFYLVGRAEDRDRAATAKPPPAPPSRRPTSTPSATATSRASGAGRCRRGAVTPKTFDRCHPTVARRARG